MNHQKDSNISTSTSSFQPCAYLLIENPNKSNNLGPILRCAAAFAIQQVIFIGSAKCTVRGSHGSSKHVHIKAFQSHEAAVSYLKDECGVVCIVGLLGDVSSCNNSSNSSCRNTSSSLSSRMVVEDDELNIVKVTTTGDTEDNNHNTTTTTSCSSSVYYSPSYPIHKRQFPINGNICFSINKRSIGLPIIQAKHCDSFMHVETSSSSIPNNLFMYGLLDSQTCLSIALHHYNAFIGLEERDFHGQKFDVTVGTQRGRMNFDVNGEDVRRKRLEKRLQLQEEINEINEIHGKDESTKNILMTMFDTQQDDNE